MADFLEEKKREIEARLKELRPLVEEYQRLEAAAAALDGVSSAATVGTVTRRRTTNRTSPTTSGRRGRPRGSGTRAKEALELIRSRPGITIRELAEAMGIQQNYLYRVLPGLERDGLVRKKDKGWHAREAA